MATTLSSLRLEGAELLRREESVADEVPVALVYNGRSHAVMMATPADLEDFAYGFSLSEGIIDRVDELEVVDVLHLDAGISVQCLIPESRSKRLAERGRNLTGRTGCGLCGAESLDAAIRPIRQLSDARPVARQAIQAAFATLAGHQPLNDLSGAVHAAGLVHANGFMAREDVGRHNALDKLIGSAARAGVVPHFAVMTSRASYEVVHKSAQAGIGLVATISGPTRLAIQLAEEANLTLVAYVRDTRMTVYSHAWRLGAEV